jgi:hypothetical protein
MGRHVGRSRGCQTCVKRRVKVGASRVAGSSTVVDEQQCGEETPACFQCVSAGFDCPGPVQGAIFIDMSEGIREKSMRTVSKSSNKKILKVPNWKSCPNSVAFKALSSDTVKCMRIASQAFKLPTTRQPSCQDIFQDVYVANFISAQNATVHPWILELPNLTSLSSSYLSEVYGIRAATLALYARISHNLDLEVEAAKWYSQGLVAQQQELHLAMSTESYSPCCHKAIGAAVMFSYFESVITTVPMGWMQHYAAAIKMFEIAGPENCQTGLMHKFFRSVRVAAVCAPQISYLMNLADEGQVHDRIDSRRTLSSCCGRMVHSPF